MTAVRMASTIRMMVASTNDIPRCPESLRSIAVLRMRESFPPCLCRSHLPAQFSADGALGRASDLLALPVRGSVWPVEEQPMCRSVNRYLSGIYVNIAEPASTIRVGGGGAGTYRKWRIF